MRKGMISEMKKGTQKLLVTYFASWSSYMGSPDTSVQWQILLYYNTTTISTVCTL